MAAPTLTGLLASPLAALLVIGAVGCGGSSASSETSTLTEGEPGDDVVDEPSSDESDVQGADSDDIAQPGDEETDPAETDSDEAGADDPDSTGGDPTSDPGLPAPPAVPPPDPLEPVAHLPTEPPPRGPPLCPRLRNRETCEQVNCLAIVSLDGIYQGCTYPTSCNEMVTCGQAPGGMQAEFPNGCLPITWETCEAAAEVEC